MDAPVAADFDRIDKDALADSRGLKFKELRRTLTPRYGVVWLHILAGHAVIAAAILGLVEAQARAPELFVVAALPGAIVIGYTVAYLQLFFHEAAHFNLAKEKRHNDVLANIFIGSLVGQDIKAYRPIHFDHHRFLGTPKDTERTYFDPLDARFLVESLVGIKILRVLLGRESAAKGDARGAGGKKSLVNLQLALGLVLHAAIVGVALWQRQWALLAAWLVGMGVVFPFFAAVRQVLEHRDFAASADKDYRREAHGAINRVFGDGPLASTLGGAGFNRHLLHHWEPQISYTQLRALETYLLDTPLADAYRTHKTSYVSAFARLFASPRHAPSTPRHDSP